MQIDYNCFCNVKNVPDPDNTKRKCNWRFRCTMMSWYIKLYDDDLVD